MFSFHGKVDLHLNWFVWVEERKCITVAKATKPTISSVLSLDRAVVKTVKVGNGARDIVPSL